MVGTVFRFQSSVRPFRLNLVPPRQQLLLQQQQQEDDDGTKEIFAMHFMLITTVFVY